MRFAQDSVEPAQLGADTPTPAPRDSYIPDQQQNRVSSQPTAPESSEGFDIFLYIRVLLAHWYVILILGLLGAAAGHLYCEQATPLYRSATVIEFLKNYNVNRDNVDVLGQNYRWEWLSRHKVILQGEKLNSIVRRNVQDEAEDLGIPEDHRWGTLEVDNFREARATMLNISVQSPSALYAYTYIGELMKQFNIIIDEETRNVGEASLVDVNIEMDKLDAGIADLREEMQRFQLENELIYQETLAGSQQALLSNLVDQKTRIEAQRQMMEKQYDAVVSADTATLQEVLSLSLKLEGMTLESGSMPNSIADDRYGGGNLNPIIVQTPSVGGLANDPQDTQLYDQWREKEMSLTRLRKQHADMIKIYKETHPKMIGLQREIDIAEQDLRTSADITLKRLKARLGALRLQEESLAQVISDVLKKFTPITELRERYVSMKKELSRLSAERNELLNRKRQLLGAYDNTITKVIEAANQPNNPYWPNRFKVLLVSTCGGVFAGCGLVLIFYFLKSRLYDFRHVEESCELRCLAGIQKLSLSHYKKIRKVPIIITRKRDSLISETFRNLRTTIENLMGEDDSVLLMTSPDPSEGKTLLALNTAAVFSWNRNRVLLIDGDFRKLSLRKAFPDAPTHGFTDILTADSYDIDDYVVKSPMPDIAPNLDYMPAGHKNEDTTELLTIERMQEVFSKLREKYDLVLIDSAPVNRVVDTLLLSKYVDGVVLVARAGKTTVPALRYCYNRISMARVLGYVLNGLDKSSSRYSYYYSGGYYSHARYYYHSYAYKGYYGKSDSDDNE